MGSRGLCFLGVIALAVSLCVGCADPTATDSQSGDPSPAPPGALALSFSGGVLHTGDYCHFLQQAIPGNNTLPAPQGCQFDMTKPADLFATDGANYSVQEVVGDARLGVRGPADAKVIVACRLQPRGQFWFWLSADGHWNIDSVADVHNPQDLVGAQDEEPLRQFIKTGGVLNDVQFKCAGGQGKPVILAVNMNGHQFTALTAPPLASGAPLSRPLNPWFVDIGARLTSPGELQGTVAVVTLYDRE